jgi:iron complex outermembrane receptor protein
MITIVATMPARLFADNKTVTSGTYQDEIVVTATRTKKTVSDAPGSVSVVTADDMKKKNIQSADEALNTLPGVFDNRIKGLMGTTSTVTFRGLSGSARTLTMLDGMPLNDAYSSGQSWGGLYIQDLERIEVVRGPSSSLWGGSAMGGVINMISVMPEKQELSFSSGYGSSLSSDRGMKNLWSNHISYGDKIGKVRFYTSFGYRSTDGYPTNRVITSSQPAAGITGWTRTTDNKGVTKYLVGDTGNNGWWDYSASARVQYDFSSDSNIRLSWLRTASKYSYDTPHTYLANAAGAPVYTTTGLTEKSFLSGDGSTTQDIYTLSAETLLGNIKTKFLFGVSDQGENWYNTPTTATLAGGPGTKSDSPNRTCFADLQFSSPLMEKHLLTGGFSVRYNTADSNNFPLSDYKDENSVSGTSTQWGGGVTTTYSAYLQAEIALLKNLKLYAGLRDDYWISSDGYAGQTGSAAFSATYPEKSKNAVSPKGALVWHPADGTTIRVSGGRAFRAPSLNQLYKTWVSDSSTLRTTYNANPDLDPETVISWDAGIEQKLWQGAKIRATYFENYLSDMIYYITTGSYSSGGKTYTDRLYSNVGGAETRGVELELEQKLGRNSGIFVGYTFTGSEITKYEPNPALVGKILTQAPKEMFNAGINANVGPADICLTGRYVSKRYNTDDNSDTVSGVYGSYDPFFVLDLKTSFRISGESRLSLSINNVFDRDYYVYYVSPGRSWFANLEVKL